MKCFFSGWNGPLAVICVMMMSCGGESGAGDTKSTGCKFNSDCPEGQVCSGGQCSSDARCKSDRDCAGGLFCNNGLCQTSKPCADQSQCPAGQICGLAGVCQLPDGGDPAPPPADAGDAGVSADGGGGTGDSGVSPGDGGPVLPPSECEQPSNACDPKATPDPCPEGHFCDPNKKFCVNGSCLCQGCGQDSECVASTGLCRRLTVSCSADEDCVRAKSGNWRCEKDVCVPKSIACKSDGDCKEFGLNRACDVPTGKCVAVGGDGAPCQLDSDCGRNHLCAIGLTSVCREDCSTTLTCRNPAYKCKSTTFSVRQICAP